MKVSALRLMAFAATALSCFSSCLALDAAYWLGGSTVWGQYGLADNWAIGSATNDTHAVPDMGNTIQMSTDMKLDLGGQSWSVGGTSGGSACIISARTAR